MPQKIPPQNPPTITAPVDISIALRTDFFRRFSPSLGAHAFRANQKAIPLTTTTTGYITKQNSNENTYS